MLDRGHAARRTNGGQIRRAVLLAVAGLWVMALATAAPAAASPGAGAKLTIQPWQGGVFGYVQSSKPGSCAAGRRVQVLVRRRGRNVHIGTATARRRGGRYQWAIKTSRSGQLFAMASSRPGCRGAKSASLSPKGSLNEIPNCPSNAAVCHFPNMHGDMVEFAICPGFGAASGSCRGSAEGGVAPWSPNDKAIFGWQGSATGSRSVWYYAKYSVDDEHTAVAASLVGDVPNPGSADFKVVSATDPHGPADTKDTAWYTPNVAGAAAGTEGGPLYLDFENGSWGFDIYIRGYLYKK